MPDDQDEDQNCEAFWDEDNSEDGVILAKPIIIQSDNSDSDSWI